MLGVRLSQDLEKRLTLLSTKTGRTKSYYVKKTLEQYLEDQEDLMLAIARSSEPGEFYTLEEAKKFLGI